MVVAVVVVVVVMGSSSSSSSSSTYLKYKPWMQVFYVMQWLTM